MLYLTGFERCCERVECFFFFFCLYYRELTEISDIKTEWHDATIDHLLLLTASRAGSKWLLLFVIDACISKYTIMASSQSLDQSSNTPTLSTCTSRPIFSPRYSLPSSWILSRRTLERFECGFNYAMCYLRRGSFVQWVAIGLKCVCVCVLGDDFLFSATQATNFDVLASLPLTTNPDSLAERRL